MNHELILLLTLLSMIWRLMIILLSIKILTSTNWNLSQIFLNMYHIVFVSYPTLSIATRRHIKWRRDVNANCFYILMYSILFIILLFFVSVFSCVNWQCLLFIGNDLTRHHKPRIPSCDQCPKIILDPSCLIFSVEIVLKL